jgi:hypothetical protein
VRVARLPVQALSAIRAGFFTYTHGVALALLAEDTEAILDFTFRAIEGKWKADALETEVRAHIEEKRRQAEAQAAANAPKLELVPAAAVEAPSSETPDDDASTQSDTPPVEDDAAETSGESAPDAETPTDETPAETSDESPAPEPIEDEHSTPEPKVLEVDEQVRWQAARGNKIHTGKVKEVGRALV